MSALLKAHGFGRTEQVGQRDSVSAQLWDRADTLRPIRLSMLAHAILPQRDPAPAMVPQATIPG